MDMDVRHECVMRTIHNASIEFDKLRLFFYCVPLKFGKTPFIMQAPDSLERARRTTPYCPVFVPPKRVRE
jgi:hypothetical protein